MKSKIYEVLSVLLAIVFLVASLSCSPKVDKTLSDQSTPVGNQTAIDNIPLVVPKMVGPGELGLAGTVIEVKCSSQKGGQLEKDGVIISVPTGAVSADKVVTLKECTEDPPPYVQKTGENPLPVAVSLSKTYDLGPDGISFDKPVTITLPYDKTLLEENADSSRIGIFYYNGQNWISAGGLVDRQKGTVTVFLNSFPGLLVEVALGGVILSSFGYAINKGYKYFKGDPVSNKNVSSLVTPNEPVITKYVPTSGVHVKVGGIFKWVNLEKPANPGQVNPEFKSYLKTLNAKSQDRIGFDGDNKGIGFVPTYNVEEKYRWIKPGDFFNGNAKGDCSSISLAYLSLLRKMGIKAYGVDGYKSDLPGDKRHAWVEFCVDGEVYYYDHDEGIKNLRDVESKLTRPKGLKKEGYMWDEKGQQHYIDKWWEETSIFPPSLTGEVNKEYTFEVKTSTSQINPQYEWYINDITQNAIFAGNIFKTKFIAPGNYTIRVKLINSSGSEVASATSEVIIKEGTAFKLMDLVLQPTEYPVGFILKNKFENITSTTGGVSRVPDRVQYTFEKRVTQMISDWNTGLDTRISYVAAESLYPIEKVQESLEEEAAKTIKYYTAPQIKLTTLRNEPTVRLWKVERPTDTSGERVVYTGVIRINQYLITFTVSSWVSSSAYKEPIYVPVPSDLLTKQFSELDKCATAAYPVLEQILKTKYGMK